MFIFNKKFVLLALSTAILIGCATSAEINQESAVQYADTVNKARAANLLDTTSTTAKRVHNVFYKMRPYADQENKTGQKFNWEISVIKDKNINAWAMPGGKMVFYTGLVETLALSDDEIAVVMGHEMAHALKEHGKASRNLGMLTTVIGTVADIAASVALKTDVSGLASSAVAIGVDRPYSRSNETEADEIGLFLMAKSGYNPQAAPELWTKMQQASGSSKGALDALISTHPSNSDRQENLQRLIPQAMKVYNSGK